MNIYIKQSFKKRLKMHVNIFIILMCAVILPLIFSIYRDSYLYGNKLNIVYQTQNAHYIIKNATEDYIPYFQNLSEFDIKFIDGNLYFTIKDEINAKLFIKGEYLPKDISQDYLSILYNIMISIPDESLLLGNLSGLYQGATNSINYSFQLTFIITIFILISMLVIQAAYRIHIGNFTHEVGILMAIGATKKQITRIFAIELIVLFILAGISALIISGVLMALLFHFYLQTDASTGNFSWVIFHIDSINTAIIFAILFVFLVGVFILSIRQFFKKMPIDLLSSSENNEKLKRYKKSIKSGKDSIITLAKTLLRRSNKSFIHCMIIVIPILVTSIFLFNYISLNIDVITKKTDYDIYINKYSLMDRIFDEEEVSFLNNMKGIEKIDFYKDINDYFLEINYEPGYTFITQSFDDKMYMNFTVRTSDNIPSNLSIEINKGNIVLNKNHVLSKNYKIGDIIVVRTYKFSNVPKNEIILNYDDHDDDNEHEHEISEGFSLIEHEFIEEIGEPLVFTISGFIDDEWSESPFVLYFNESDYTILAGENEYTYVKIKASDNVNYEEFVEIINQKFNDKNKYSISDERRSQEIAENGAIGIYILIEFILIITFVFLVILLYVFLCEYIRGQSENIKLIYILGASKDDVYYTYMLQSLVVLLITIFISFTIGMNLSGLFFANTGYYLKVDFMMVLTYFIATAIVAISFLLPIHLELKKKFKAM